MDLCQGLNLISIHPITTDSELKYFLDAMEETVSEIQEWEKDHENDAHINEFVHKDAADRLSDAILGWFSMASDPVRPVEGRERSGSSLFLGDLTLNPFQNRK